MQLTRWISLPLLLALPLLAVACGGGEGGGRVTREITADDLASMVLTAEEVSDILGLALDELESGPDLGQEFEGVAIEKAGFVAGYVALYRSRQGNEGAYYTLALFERPNGASGALKQLLEGLARTDPNIDKFDAGNIGEEAQGIVFPTSLDEPAVTGVALRVDRVLASVFVGHRPDQDMREQARKLAEKLAEKIEAVLEG